MIRAMTGRAAGLNHVSVVAHDLAESVRFYREMFGMEELPTPDFGFPVQWLRLGDLQLHLFERPDGPPVYAHFAIQVDDVVALVHEAQRRGILDDTTFGYAMAELPGGEAQIYLRDPSGNLVEVDHPDGAAARARIPGMILFTERRPQAEGPVPRLFLDPR
jgi:catechol 2,3-dioxygenase-like lactoylglutathione lyase family enzyme